MRVAKSGRDSVTSSGRIGAAAGGGAETACSTAAPSSISTSRSSGGGGAWRGFCGGAGGVGAGTAKRPDGVPKRPDGSLEPGSGKVGVWKRPDGGGAGRYFSTSS